MHSVLYGSKSAAYSVLYGSWPAVYSASKPSSVAAQGRLLPLYAAAQSTPLARSCVHGERSTACLATLSATLNAPPASSCKHGRQSTACLLTHLICSLGAWCGQRSGIKGEPAGRRTAAKLFTPSAKACSARSQFLKTLQPNFLSSQSSRRSRVDLQPLAFLAATKSANSLPLL